MKKNGFTLIELLAVIVILAIIALIATPIALNIIEDSKKSSKLNSAEHYLDAVEQAIIKYNMSSGNAFIPSECEIQSDGDLLCDSLEEEITVEVSGETPTKGTIIMKNGKIENQTFLIYNSETIIIKNSSKLEFAPTPKSFEEDSWETIVANVKAGNISAYNVGDTKEIALTGFTNGETDSNGLYTIRIANTSTPAECSTIGFSQTACGFVIEFVDIITTHAMNSTNNTNVGGWNASQMRTYVNETIYNALPNVLKEKIIDTYVVSGHGNTSGETNFTTTDKVYLLSTKEVFGKEGTSNITTNDTSEVETRQLYYYESIGVTTANYSGTKKKYNGSAVWWWLRSAGSHNTYDFYIVSNLGGCNNRNASRTYGVAVAFRIG